MSWEVEILCRRLNIEQGIVSMRVALRYDLLRFSPRSCRFVHLDDNYVIILYGYIFTLKSAWNKYGWLLREIIWSLLHCIDHMISHFFSLKLENFRLRRVSGLPWLSDFQLDLLDSLGLWEFPDIILKDSLAEFFLCSEAKIDWSAATYHLPFYNVVEVRVRISLACHMSTING